MSSAYSEAVATARDYYNSEDADNYSIIWGGEDIHIGLYQSDAEAITEASHRTVRHMAETLGNINTETKLLDIGAGYGGAARYLAETFGCSVTALNLSEKENARNRQLNAERGLTDKIKVSMAVLKPSRPRMRASMWSGHRMRSYIAVIVNRWCRKWRGYSNPVAGLFSLTPCNRMIVLPVYCSRSWNGFISVHWALPRFIAQRLVALVCRKSCLKSRLGNSLSITVVSCRKPKSMVQN